MANSANPDQLAQKPTDLDLHCLQRQDISGFSRTGVKVCFDVLLVPVSCYCNTVVMMQQPGSTV